MIGQEHYRKLEWLYASAPCNRYFAPEISISEGEAEIVLPIREDLHHAGHAVHGTVYFKAADDAGYFAVNSLVEDVLVLTVQINLHLLRPVSRGVVRGRGRVVQATERLWVAESIVSDEAEREIGRASGVFVRSRVPLTPDIGYRSPPA